MQNQSDPVGGEEHSANNAIRRVGSVEGEGGQMEAIPESPAGNVRDTCRKNLSVLAPGWNFHVSGIPETSK